MRKRYDDPGRSLHPDLQATLALLRRRRGFDAPAYIRAKATLLNSYFRDTGVSAAVVGVSGGIDSAVTLGLLSVASRMKDSPIRRIVAALMPMFVEVGATNQDVAKSRGQEVAEAFGAEIVTVDLSRSLGVVKDTVDGAFAVKGGAWAAGQLVSYLRTPAFYYLATLVSQEGNTCVVCGTTNRDEGSYIGFFGKASDGMVDLQPISDIHKSEVHGVARLLGVPESVCVAVPTGDTFDGRPDVEMIGAPYDFLELYELFLCSSEERDALRQSWSPAAKEEFDRFADRVEDLHRVNAHKYVGGTPAVHLDVYDRAVPGGWRSDHPAAVTLVGSTSSSGKFVGEFTLTPAPVLHIQSGSAPSEAHALADFGESVQVVDSLLTAQECELLLQEVSRQKRVPVGQNGMRSDFDPAHDPVGSFRATAVDEKLARAIWERLSDQIPLVRTMEDCTPTDWNGHRIWRAIGLNPVLRFIWTEAGGLLVPHYDAGFDFGDERRHSLMSVIVYLSAPQSGAGGATRFLRDRQRHLPLAERVYQDWKEPPRPGDILATVEPERGRALVFDHRILHDGELWNGTEPRLILRTDVIFERCGLRPKTTSNAVRRPLHDTLAVDPGASRASVDEAYRRKQEGSPPERLRALTKAWKVLRDPFYKGVYAKLGSLPALEEAGYFDDTGTLQSPDTVQFDPEWMVTPLHKISQRLRIMQNDESAGAPLKPLVVLLSTGAFSPIHDGHVEMMEAARQCVEEDGAAVLGGFISPSHDEYVTSKCGAENIGAEHRIRLCEEAVRHSDWLMVDPWEAMHIDRAVNFTEVIDRLEQYLSRHLLTHRPVNVVYLFGSDNARFVLSFVDRGRCVCIPRPGYDDRIRKYAEHPLVRDQARILMPRQALTGNISSSAVRNGDLSPLDSRVRHLWTGWTNLDRKGALPSDHMSLYLRDEWTWATEPWRSGGNAPAVDRAHRPIISGLKRALEHAFKGGRGLDRGRPLSIQVLDLEQQRRSYAAIREGGMVLSMDPCLPGDQNLAVSRRFHLGGRGALPILVNRPGSPPISEQMAKIPPGDYVLFDDDIATGQTMAIVKSLLPEQLRIRSVKTLCRLDDRARSDLCDLRDFLVGSREGGLVVVLPDGSIARSPYLLPYVSPAARLGLPPCSVIPFSRRIWEMNRDFFRLLPRPLRLSDASFGFQILCKYIGFDENTLLADICEWHLERLCEPVPVVVSAGEAVLSGA